MASGRRRFPRKAVKFKALIANLDGTIVGPCRTADISQEGAKLEIPEQITMPKDFVLIFSQNGQVRRRCQVIWMDLKRIGVHFTADKVSG